MIPIGDSPRASITPWATYAFIAVNLAVFLYTLTLSTAVPRDRVDYQRELVQQTDGTCYGFIVAPNEVGRFFCRYSYQPREFLDNVRGESKVPEPGRAEVLFSIFSAMFLHAGWLHILGNMLFLWVFGDNVEDRLGHLGYVVFYLVAGVAAALTQTAVDTSSVIPNVGASGAVAGVLGAYLVYYPKATVKIVIPFFPLVFLPFAVPAVFMIGLWFVQNLLSGFATIGVAEGAPDTGVAFFAHIGGFVFGALTALLFLRGRRRQPPRFRQAA
jgi:membrane associated rhomboid family serine protease